ncbi:LDCC motif putative metal-binding protein [Acetoanaerobium noterae]|nr:LDCC motif putative metal-binding protein [Acetoanaerobium noterae]
MKEKIKKWLDKLASANQETFGTERMDCCELNRKPAPVQKGKAVPKSK